MSPTLLAPSEVEEFTFSLEFEFVATEGHVHTTNGGEEFACHSAACAPHNGGGSLPGNSRGAGHVGVILPTSKGATDPHGRTRPMDRDNASDKFWDETMVGSANGAGLTKDAKTGDEVVEQFAKNTQNMYEIMDKFGNPITDGIIANSENWYPAAGDIAATRAAAIGMRTETSVAVLAALSPGHDWDSNIREHEIALNVFSKNAPVDGAATGAILRSIVEGQLSAAKTDAQRKNSQAKLDDIDGLIKRSDGVPFNDLSLKDRARLMKAHAMAQGEDFGKDKWSLNEAGEAYVDGKRFTLAGEVQKINFQSERTWEKIFKLMDSDAAGGAAHTQALSEALGAGAKVRSFNNNIGSPQSSARDVTVDTHATSVVVGHRVAQTSAEYTAMAGGASSAGDGLKGPYLAAVEAYRQVADQRGIMPRAAQSQTWVAQKGINDYIDGSPTTSSLRATLSNPKKAAALSPEARKYLQSELEIRDAFGKMVDGAREGGYTIS